MRTTTPQHARRFQAVTVTCCSLLLVAPTDLLAADGDSSFGFSGWIPIVFFLVAFLFLLPRTLKRHQFQWDQKLGDIATQLKRIADSLEKRNDRDA